MALQVWLPLNGNLNNQGLCNVTVTNNGATVNNSGKIGKCYSLSGSSQKITASFPISVSNTIGSLSCWVKFNALPSSSAWFNLMQVGASGGFAACRLGMYFEHGSGINISINGSSTGANYKAYTFTTGVWYHICAIYDGTNVKLYINGIEQLNKTASVGSYTTAATTLFMGGTSSYYLNGYLNDCRYYDHALSAKEVEELSKGLVLHYKLDNDSMWNSNILTGTYYNSYVPSAGAGSNAINANGIWAGGSGGNGTFSVTFDSTCPVGSYSWNVLNNTSGNRDFQQGNQPYVSGQKYTTSFWAKGSGTCLYRSWNTTDGKAMFTKTWTLTSSWTYYTYTFTASAEMETDMCTFHLGVQGAASINMCGMKMELGEKATPYSVAKNELGSYDKIYDSSGYGNHGTITGSLSASLDSARYNISLYTSIGNTNYITSPIMYLPGDQITMNFWFKSSNKTPGSDYHMPFEGTGSSNQSYEMSIYKTGYLRGGLVVGGSRKVDNCTSTKLTDGSWHMCTMTYDGATIKRYVDGVMEKSTATTGALVTSTSFVLGHYGSNTSYYSKETYTSDVRLYTTALTEAQIKELYNTSSTIDNLGNVYAREVVG